MKFKDIRFSQKNQFSIGIEENSGKYFLSIPVSNSYVDYEEYYELTEEQFTDFNKNMELALPFVKMCRNRQNDSLIMQKPGKNRGFPT